MTSRHQLSTRRVADRRPATAPPRRVSRNDRQTLGRLAVRRPVRARLPRSSSMLPLAYAFYLSLYSKGLATGTTFAGIDNYVKAFTDPSSSRASGSSSGSRSC